jgi:hypothetical protein
MEVMQVTKVMDGLAPADATLTFITYITFVTFITSLPTCFSTSTHSFHVLACVA